MEPGTDQSPLVVIVGQSGSGKSALALDLAERWDGEIIAADSRTVYRHMDIGTAKPSIEERQRIPHHLIDIIDPDELFTVSNFQRFAQRSITDISRRGKLPFLVGGTGLYIDAILFNFSFRGGNVDFRQREELAALSVVELQSLLQQQGIPLPHNAKNPRHLIRAIETNGVPGTRQNLRARTLIMGLQLEREILERRIVQRVDAMLAAGLAAEAVSLAKRYGWACPSLQTIGYQEFEPYFTGNVSLQEVRQSIIVHTMQYAKRQRTWFRRNKGIHWISKMEEAVELLTTFLNK